jgi:hypothetical protein
MNHRFLETPRKIAQKPRPAYGTPSSPAGILEGKDGKLWTERRR